MVITCITVYILSAILCWLYTHLYFNKGGIGQYPSPTKIDVVVMFVPIYNTLYLLAWTLSFPLRTKKNYIKKFFMIKDK